VFSVHLGRSDRLPTPTAAQDALVGIVTVKGFGIVDFLRLVAGNMDMLVLDCDNSLVLLHRAISVVVVAHGAV